MLKINEEYFYVKTKGKVLRLISDRAAQSWNAHVIEMNRSDLDYNIVGSLGFRPGSVMMNFTDSKIYILDAGSLTLIDDPDILDSIGNPPIVQVSQEEIDYHGVTRK